jgi:alkane 1-monooxygenase
MEQLKRRGKSAYSLDNAFVRYAFWAIFWLTTAYLMAGITGIGFFVLQAFIAASLLEIVNYIEHYGLERRKRPDGTYEPVQPYHSWNADHRLTSYALLNLQRHSDHHCKPQRRYPLLQSYKEDQAPILPYSYSLLVFLTLVPPVWFAFMHPRLDAWHKKYHAAA